MPTTSVHASLSTRRGRCRAAFAVALALAAGALAPGVASATLANSTFEDADGNLVAGNAAVPLAHDWNTPIEAIACPAAAAIPTPADGVGTNCGRDVTNSKVDNSFGQGSKEDIDPPTPTSGSIPPNKSDLTRFYVNKEKVSGHDLLYLAWERSNVLGNANMDFEFNQQSAAAGLIPTRTADDVLITFDFVNGGSRPQLGIMRWLTATGADGTAGTADDGAATRCYANNALPCWGDQATLGDAVAEGAVNTATAADNNAPTASLPSLTFGEAGIDLQAAGVFHGCQHFGSAYLKSRSAASFTAELKDYIAPIPVNVSNCGSLTVQKYIDVNESGAASADEIALTTANPAGSVLAGDLAGWSFTVTGPSSFSCTGTTLGSGLLGPCVKADTSTADLSALPVGTYTVTENANTGRTIGTSPGSAFLNIDPGADNADGGTTGAAAPVHETVNLGTSGSAAVDFGNSCYATANFQVDSIPSGQSGLFVRYSVAGDLTSPHDVNLTLKAGTTDTYVAAVSGLRRSNTVSWSYGINHGGVGGTEQTKAVTTTFALSGYPSCAGTGSASFSASTISGTKYKDIDADGVKDVGEGPLQGFTFQLKRSGSVLDTQRSDSAGGFSFTGVAPGTYTIHETSPPTGWAQTQPASGGDVTVAVALGAGTVTDDTSSHPIRFGNTPKSTVQVLFRSTAKLLNADGTESATNATRVDPDHPIACTDQASTVLTLTGALSSDKTTPQLTLPQSPVTCAVTFIDP